MMNVILKRLLAALMLVTFLVSSVVPSCAQGLFLSPEMGSLPQPGTMVGLTSAFQPVLLRGLKVDPRNPFRMDFIIQDRDQPSVDIKDESSRMIKYFLAALTTPEKDLWVNLSPYEKDRIIPENFGMTGMGRDLLAQDYILKQVTASLMHPDGEVGKAFWKRIYARVYEEFGTTDVPVDTFNKVWIVPDLAQVYEEKGIVFIGETRLKVMLESDYWTMENSREESRGKAPPVSPTQEMTRDVVRDVMLPIIEKEVNEGASFAPLRQIYHALVLAHWYKKRLQDSVLSKVYADRSKTDGVDVPDKEIRKKIWAEYVESFKKGAYNYIKEERDEYTQELIPRKYFSGGFVSSSQQMDNAMKPLSKEELEGQLTHIKSPVKMVSAFLSRVGAVGARKVVTAVFLFTIAQALISPPQMTNANDNTGPNVYYMFEQQNIISEDSVDKLDLGITGDEVLSNLIQSGMAERTTDNEVRILADPQDIRAWVSEAFKDAPYVLKLEEVLTSGDATADGALPYFMRKYPSEVNGNEVTLTLPNGKILKIMPVTPKVFHSLDSVLRRPEAAGGILSGHAGLFQMLLPQGESGWKAGDFTGKNIIFASCSARDYFKYTMVKNFPGATYVMPTTPSDLKHDMPVIESIVLGADPADPQFAQKTNDWVNRSTPNDSVKYEVLSQTMRTGDADLERVTASVNFSTDDRGRTLFVVGKELANDQRRVLLMTDEGDRYNFNQKYAALSDGEKEIRMVYDVMMDMNDGVSLSMSIIRSMLNAGNHNGRTLGVNDAEFRDFLSGYAGYAEGDLPLSLLYDIVKAQDATDAQVRQLNQWLQKNGYEPILKKDLVKQKKEGELLYIPKNYMGRRNIFNENNKLRGVSASGSVGPASDARADHAENLGGIDLNSSTMNMDIKSDGSVTVNAVDPAMLAIYEAASGLEPEIMGVTPVNDLPAYFGITLR
jgi:hypothetical protein